MILNNSINKTDSINNLYILFFSLLLFLLCSCSEKNPSVIKAFPIGKSQTDYIIKKGDILDIVTWKEADFTKNDLIVRMDGKITFPLLDDIIAAGKTTIQEKKRIETGLKKYIESPAVTVSVKTPVSQKFYILGEILKKGEYQLNKEVTILQAISMAGGFTDWASKKITLIRKINGKPLILKIDYEDIVNGNNIEMNVIIKANDTIIIP